LLARICTFSLIHDHLKLEIITSASATAPPLPYRSFSPALLCWRTYDSYGASIQAPRRHTVSLCESCRGADPL